MLFTFGTVVSVSFANFLTQRMFSTIRFSEASDSSTSLNFFETFFILLKKSEILIDLSSLSSFFLAFA